MKTTPRPGQFFTQSFNSILAQLIRVELDYQGPDSGILYTLVVVDFGPGIPASQMPEFTISEEKFLKNWVYDEKDNRQ